MYSIDRTLSFLLITVFLASACGIALATNADSEIPLVCQSGCASPYGEILGESPRRIKAYSNCQSSCVIYQPNQWNGTYTGIKWQCVEYARRWLLVNTGTVFGDVDIAADMWNKIDYLTDVKTKKRVPLVTHLNGSTQAPEVGDLLIYAKAYKDTGHVAVVTGIDIANGSIEVGEQNFNNERWTNHYARRLKLTKNGESYWLLDGYLLGWKHAMFEPQ